MTSVRLRVVCRGVVQGVGFRPCVHRLASDMGLSGSVRNGPQGATIEVEGPAPLTRAFLARLRLELPPLAVLDSLEAVEIPPEGRSTFEILPSLGGAREKALVPPDSALCADCRAEMEDPGDRRRFYPFTTCTNCGPRFTLASSLPYDRERTSMACFPLCEACAREYADPGDRRFHAEPVCCPACGPRLWLSDPRGARLSEGAAAIEAARDQIAQGRILAVKGLGGFQLACRADDGDAVDRLRLRKRRPTKPFALMARDLAEARRLLFLAEQDERMLLSARAPVLLCPSRPDTGLAPGLAPGLDDLGVMLPTTPLHVELFRGAPYGCLVMTSGNASDEPICRGNREALEALGAIADLFLLHDRDILRRADDSVVRSSPGGPFLVRRARGWVPRPIVVPTMKDGAVLALGGHLQATACLCAGGEAFLSQHVGDLDTASARAFLREAAEGLEDFLQARAETLVVDAHPDYASTRLGEELADFRGARLIRVQHHLAHAAAVLAEHGVWPRPGESVMSLALDGTGWGPDGAAWGGEWLVLDGDLRWRRPAHLEPVPLLGGEAAVREPWRVLVASLAQSGHPELLPRLPVARRVPERTMAAVLGMSPSPSWPRATGAGRLFEAAGALLGLAFENEYEGEAAARLESLAAGSRGSGEPWPEPCLGEAPILPGPALLAEAGRRLIGGEKPQDVALGFHVTFCELAARLTARVLPERATVVALGGGCMVNRILRTELARRLAAMGLRPLLPHQAPPGDGGLALGQAVLGAAAATVGSEPLFEE